jgi:fatty acid desaturase
MATGDRFQCRLHEFTMTSKLAIPNRLNLAVLLGQIAVVAGCFVALPRLGSGWALAGVTLVFAIVMNSVYAIIHEAEHGMLFSNGFWNDLAGSLMAMLFPAPFHLIRQGHLGHHLRNRTDDEAFDFYFEEDHKVWKFLVFYGILTGLYYVMVVLSNLVFLLIPFRSDQKYWRIDQASTAFLESFNPRYRLVIWLECAAVLLLHSFLVWWLNIPIGRYCIMYAGFGLMWSSMQYVHHYGTERHVTRGARNLWIWGPLDSLWLNHNLHLNHHAQPAVPWIHLPKAPAEGDPKAGFLLPAYLRMWRGPRPAPDRVPNKAAGRLIP